MALYENFFVGDTEYRIRFRNGIHQIVEVATQTAIYEGWYERCIAYRDRMIADYQATGF